MVLHPSATWHDGPSPVAAVVAGVVAVAWPGRQWGQYQIVCETSKTICPECPDPLPCQPTEHSTTF